MSADQASPLGKKVRDLRARLGWSAKDLSEAAGGTPTRCVITDLENGRRSDLPTAWAIAVAEAFDIGIEELLGLESFPYNRGYTDGRRDAWNEAVDVLRNRMPL